MKRGARGRRGKDRHSRDGINETRGIRLKKGISGDHVLKWSEWWDSNPRPVFHQFSQKQVLICIFRTLALVRILASTKDNTLFTTPICQDLSAFQTSLDGINFRPCLRCPQSHVAAASPTCRDPRDRRRHAGHLRSGTRGRRMGHEALPGWHRGRQGRASSLQETIAASTEALKQRVPLYEAAISAGGGYARADILNPEGNDDTHG
jgi:hypothetical protein